MVDATRLFNQTIGRKYIYFNAIYYLIRNYVLYFKRFIKLFYYTQYVIGRRIGWAQSPSIFVYKKWNSFHVHDYFNKCNSNRHGLLYLREKRKKHRLFRNDIAEEEIRLLFWFIESFSLCWWRRPLKHRHSFYRRRAKHCRCWIQIGGSSFSLFDRI